jgi:hypothetical protein
MLVEKLAGVGCGHLHIPIRALVHSVSFALFSQAVVLLVMEF